MIFKQEDTHPQTVSHGYVTSTEVDEKTRDEQWMYFAIIISLMNLSVENRVKICRSQKNLLLDGRQSKCHRVRRGSQYLTQDTLPVLDVRTSPSVRHGYPLIRSAQGRGPFHLRSRHLPMLRPMLQGHIGRTWRFVAIPRQSLDQPWKPFHFKGFSIRPYSRRDMVLCNPRPRVVLWVYRDESRNLTRKSCKFGTKMLRRDNSALGLEYTIPCSPNA